MLSSLSTEDLIPAEHPIRRIRVVVDEVLGELDGVFESMYSTKRRPSVLPEMVTRLRTPSFFQFWRHFPRIRGPTHTHQDGRFRLIRYFRLEQCGSSDFSGVEGGE